MSRSLRERLRWLTGWGISPHRRTSLQQTARLLPALAPARPSPSSPHRLTGCVRSRL